MAERKPARRRATTQTVQAAVEGVVLDDGKVEFMGEYFKMADRIGLMPLLKFAHASSQGLDSNDMEGLAALYDMLSDCIDQTVPEAQKKDPVTGEMRATPVGQSEWKRFERHAIETKAESEDLMKLVQRVIEALAARPSLPPGDSSAGRRTTSANSKVSSSRPDMEGMVSPADLAR